MLLLFSQAAFSQAYKKTGSEIVMQDPDYAEKKYVYLDCLWDYVDKEFIDPSFFYSDNKITENDVKEINGISVKIPHKLLDGKGFGTYHLTIKNLKKNTSYGIPIYKWFLNCEKIFVNGDCVYDQENGRRKNSTDKKALRNMRAVNFLSDENGTVDFVVHVSNNEFKFGGMILVPRIAEEAYIYHYMLKNIFFECIVSGALFVLLLYNLIIFLLNKKQYMYLCLAVLCFDLIFVICLFDFSSVGYLFNPMTYSLSYRLSLISIMLIVPLYNLYLINLYGINKKRNNLILIVDFICPLLAIVLPMKIISDLAHWSMIILYVSSVYLCVLAMTKRDGPKIMYVTNGIIIIIMMMSSAFGILTPYFIPFVNNSSIIFKLAIHLFAIVQSGLAGLKRDYLSDEIKDHLIDYEKMNNLYNRFVPIQSLKFLQVSDDAVVKCGDSYLTDGLILVINIRKFSDYGRRSTTKNVFDLISKYYEIVVSVISKNNGCIVKFFGDQIVAVFTDKNECACRTAIELKKKFNEELKKFEKPETPKINVGMGIHYGKIAIGFVGNDEHMESVACSKNIDEAMQIELMNKSLNSDIVISEDALIYSRAYTDCLFEGSVTELNGRKIVLYKVIPFTHSMYLHEESDRK